MSTNQDLSEVTKSSRIGRVYDLTKHTITFSVPGVATPLVLNLDSVSESCRTYAAYHGFGQRIGDAAAMERASRGGKPASAQEKWDAMSALCTHYNSGAEGWSPKGAERIGSDELLLARALAALRPDKDSARIREYVAGMTKAQRTALMTQDEHVRAEVEKIQAEVVKDIDTTALLEGL
jgi:hypothetical protein